MTLDQLLQRAAQEIATQAGVNVSELSTEIATWKEKIGMSKASQLVVICF
jgi:hypothetical protein